MEIVAITYLGMGNYNILVKTPTEHITISGTQMSGAEKLLEYDLPTIEEYNGGK